MTTPFSTAVTLAAIDHAIAEGRTEDDAKAFVSSEHDQELWRVESAWQKREALGSSMEQAA